MKHFQKRFNIKSISFWVCLITFIGIYASAYLTFDERVIDIENTLLPNPLFNVRLILLLLMLLLYILLIYVLYFQSEYKRKFYLYWICVGFILSAFMIRYPLRSWQAEPYWETTTNFIWQTYTRGPFKSILLDDSGYWTLFPRLISIIVIFILKQLKYAPLILQAAAVFCWTFTCAKFVKDEFHDYGTIEIRFVVALFIGTSTYFALEQITALHNIAYIGGMLLLLCCMMDMDRVSKPIFILDTLVVFLSCCSKMHLCVFMPIGIFILTVFHAKLHSRLKVFLSCCVIANILMIIYYLSGVAETVSYNISKNTESIILSTVYDFAQSFLYFFKNHNKNGYYGGTIYNLIIFLFLITSAIVSIQRRNKQTIICIGLGTFSFGIMMMNSLTRQVSMPDMKLNQFLYATSYNAGRNGFLALCAVFFLCVVFISDVFDISDKNSEKIPVILFALCCLMIRFSFVPGTLTNVSYDLNWKEYSRCLQNESYGIPAGAGKGRFLLKNAKVKYWGNEKVETIGGHFATGVSKITSLESDSTNHISFDSNETIVSVYSNKYSLTQTNTPTMLLMNQNGDVVSIVDGISEKERYTVGFILDQPCKNISGIAFINRATGDYYDMASDVYVVVEDPGKGVLGNAGWGYSSLEE